MSSEAFTVSGSAASTAMTTISVVLPTLDGAVFGIQSDIIDHGPPCPTFARTAGIMLNVAAGDFDIQAKATTTSGATSGRILTPMMSRSLPLTASPMATAVPAAVSGTSRARSSKVSAANREELLASAAALRFFVIVLEEKGGVGKSVSTQATYETLKLLREKVLLIDADVVNKNLSRMGLTERSAALDARRVDFEGFLFEAAERLTDGEVDGVVIDSAAGSEKNFRPFLPELARTLRAGNARLVVMRPMTTSPLVFDNVASFGREVMTDDMGVLLVKNMGMGRDPDEWIDFDTSPERQEMLRRGMVSNAPLKMQACATRISRLRLAAPSRRSRKTSQTSWAWSAANWKSPCAASHARRAFF